MGATLTNRDLQNLQEAFQLLVYCNVPQEIYKAAIPMNKRLASELIIIKPTRRTIQLEKCFVKLLDSLPERAVIKDIDVLFNPIYRGDVLKTLTSAYKQRQFSLIWPGSYADGKLIYSEEGYPDYRIYEIANYDIMCVI